MPIEFIDFRFDQEWSGEIINIDVPANSNIHVAFILSDYHATTPMGSDWVRIGDPPALGFMAIYMRVGELTSGVASFYVDYAGPPGSRYGGVFLASYTGSLHSYVLETDYQTRAHPQIPGPADLPQHPAQIDGYTVVRVTSISNPYAGPYNTSDWVPPPEVSSRKFLTNSTNQGPIGSFIGNTQKFSRTHDSLEPFPSVEVYISTNTIDSSIGVASLILLSATEPGVSIETPNGLGKLTIVLSGQEVQPTGLEIIQP